MLSPEDRAKIARLREQGGKVVGAGQRFVQSIPEDWRPYLIGFVVGWFLRGRRK